MMVVMPYSRERCFRTFQASQSEPVTQVKNMFFIYWISLTTPDRMGIMFALFSMF
jgi:hypothetical protein